MADPFTCPHCGFESHNPNDKQFGYCGRCSWWTGGQANPLLAALTPSMARPLPPDARTVAFLLDRQVAATECPGMYRERDWNPLTGEEDVQRRACERGLGHEGECGPQRRGDADG